MILRCDNCRILLFANGGEFLKERLSAYQTILSNLMTVTLDTDPILAHITKGDYVQKDSTYSIRGIGIPLTLAIYFYRQISKSRPSISLLKLVGRIESCS
jgi:hypothetical protein